MVARQGAAETGARSSSPRVRGAASSGYAYGRLEPRDWVTLRDRCGVGVDLWVDPARATRRRRNGARRGARRALRRGAPRVVIDVAAGNGRAAQLFARLGFRETMVELTREAPPELAARAAPGERAERRTRARPLDARARARCPAASRRRARCHAAIGGVGPYP